MMNGIGLLFSMGFADEDNNLTKALNVNSGLMKCGSTDKQDRDAMHRHDMDRNRRQNLARLNRSSRSAANRTLKNMRKAHR